MTCPKLFPKLILFLQFPLFSSCASISAIPDNILFINGTDLSSYSMKTHTKRKLARDVSQLFYMGWLGLLDENPFSPVDVHPGCLPDKAPEGKQPDKAPEPTGLHVITQRFRISITQVHQPQPLHWGTLLDHNCSSNHQHGQGAGEEWRWLHCSHGTALENRTRRTKGLNFPLSESSLTF